MTHDYSHKPFDKDVKSFGRYQYTRGKLSSKIANKVQSEQIFNLLKNYKNLNIVDFGCGDGTYTNELINLSPKTVTGIDPAKDAIDFATKNFKNSKLTFVGGGLDELNRRFTDKNSIIDVLILRGVLHHFTDSDFELFFQYLKNAKKNMKLILLEPNGLNLILKIIEKTSKYHIEHNERSFFHHSIKKKLLYSNFNNFKISFFGFTPFFCPDWMAKLTNFLHKFIVNIPIIRSFACITYTILCSKN